MGNLCSSEAALDGALKRPKANRRPKKNGTTTKRKQRATTPHDTTPMHNHAASSSPIADSCTTSSPTSGLATRTGLDHRRPDAITANPLEVAPPMPARADIECSNHAREGDGRPLVLSLSPTLEGDTAVEQQFLQDEDDQRKYSACASPLSDEWSRRVSHDRDEDAARRFSTLTDEARAYSISSSNTSSEVAPCRTKSMTVVASRPRATSSGGDGLRDQMPHQQRQPPDEGDKKPTLEEKLLRRKARALVQWLSRLPPPPYEPIESAPDACNADAADTTDDQLMWNDDVERKFSKID